MLQRTRHGPFHAPRLNHFKRIKSYKIIYSGCRKIEDSCYPAPCQMTKKLLCMECFSKSGIFMEEI
jgi:hypothetical protein